MPVSIWIATALGVAGGIALAFVSLKAVLPRMIAWSGDRLLGVKLAFAGTIIALLPALVLSVVVGGTLGSAWGRQVFAQIGVPSSGIPFGLAVGTALVFALVLLAGTAAGVLIGKAVVSYRQQ